ncbi:sulfite exporter TauE/SafE family protein [Serratia liquefaciens]|uniref:sulfite exporter TauE/SafE family protein n=1 Tax=Serratia liquefaciens TaxID=614 RepID=UPI0006618259|nr:sulfite exporter TauE/SafE family protein [Serratia liquefaciens]AMG99620.1 sulfite exporter TauE/SafE family protein [Serratia liquefaciens]HEI8954620.1 sulfite exporter TauE/SafE family protein [Serratia liquefaciens]
MQETLTLSSYLVLVAILLVAYVIFGIAGFGSALVASPVMALYIPVAKIVPLLALLDMCAAIVNVSRDGRNAQWAELKRLIPLMIIGSLVGAAILLKTRPDILLLGLGIFVVLYALYSLSGLKPDRQFSPKASVPFGLVGGIFSALFGSGGFIYAIYLSGRIEKKEAFRMTQTTLIGMSTLTRVVIFTFAGVYLDIDLLLLALVLLPGMLVGITLGRHFTLKMSREQFMKLINVILLASGTVLMVKYFS